MELIIQIKSLLFSFVFGIIFSITTSILEKIIYHKKIIFEIINTFLISIFFCLLYFICIKNINNGIIHIYFIMMVLFGVVLDKYIFKLGYKLKIIIKKLTINFNKNKNTWHHLTLFKQKI